MSSLRPLSRMAPPRPHGNPVASWDGSAIHVWGWDGECTMPIPWLYRGFSRAGLPPSPLGVGAFELELGAGHTVRPSSVRLDPARTLAWFLDWEGSPGSPSLAWFAHLGELAVAVAAAGRVLPVLSRRVDVDQWVARWQPVVDEELGATLTAVAGVMPPICAVRPGSPGTETPTAAATAAAVLDAFVDGACRRRLERVGWEPERLTTRGPDTTAVRAVFAALAGPEWAVRRLSAAATGELPALAARFQRLGMRARGEPVVQARVRLVLPDDVDLPWNVVLELVDEHDRGRWCTASDVWRSTPLAIELAGGPDHLEVLREVATDAGRRIGAAVDVLAQWGSASEPGPIALDLEQAEEFLDQAPGELEAEGVDLVGPERLVRAGVTVRGDATPAPDDDRTKGFNRDAIVKWSLNVVDGGKESAVSKAELERAQAAGATLLRSGHRWVRIDPAALRKARARVEELRDGFSVVDALSLLRLAADEADVGDVTAEGWAASLLAGLPDAELVETPEPEGFVGTLRPYQRRSLAWLGFLDRLGLGGCLADDMGLGKTATTLAHLITRPGPHLVVCPLSVVHNWEAEAARFVPSLRVVVHHGSGRAGQGDDPDQICLDGLVDDSPPDIVVTTYGLVPRDIDHLSATEWSTVVLDEAQMVKNPSTRAARAVRKLKADQKLALTGTPVENRLSELWAILDAVNPGMLGSRERFRVTFGRPIEREGDGDAAARLRRLTQPFVLRRTKSDRSLVPDLPPKIEQVAYAGLTSEQAVLYESVVAQLLADAASTSGMRRRAVVLQSLTRLKQICNHPAHVLGDGSRLAGRSGKLNRFDELVDELLDVDERALVFTQFRVMGELLHRHLDERLGMRVPFFHGGVAKRRRDAMVADFQEGLGPALLIVSLRAGGTGINLTAASQVIHYDRWWNPAVENQATDRAWRIGQGRTVMVHKLVCQGTVEEKIAALIDDKQALADVAVGSGESWLSELSTSDLRELVRLDMAVPS